MKTIKEIYEEIQAIDGYMGDDFTNPSENYDFIMKCMEEYGKLMYNQAIDDVENLHKDFFCYEEDFYKRVEVPKLKKIKE